MSFVFGKTNRSNPVLHDTTLINTRVPGTGKSSPRRRATTIAVAASTAAVAATAVFGVSAYQSGPTGPVGVHSQDVALTAGGDTAAIDASLKMLLDSIPITGPGNTIDYLGTSSLSNVLEYGAPYLNPTLGDLFSLVGLNDPTAADPTSGITTTVNELLAVFNVDQLTPINDLLGTLPVGSGDAPITGATTVETILTSLQVPAPDGGTGTIDLGNVTVNSLLASFMLPNGGGPLSDATTVGDLLDAYPSIANISLPDLLGGADGGPLSGLGGLLGGLGGVIPTLPTTVGGLVSFLGLDDDTLGSLLGFTSSTDLSDLASLLDIDGYSINSVLAEFPSNGITLTGASTLDQITDFLGIGDKTLAELLPGGADLTNASTLVDLLNNTALFGDLGSQTIDELLGLTSATAGDAAASVSASTGDVVASLF